MIATFSSVFQKFIFSSGKLYTTEIAKMTSLFMWIIFCVISFCCLHAITNLLQWISIITIFSKILDRSPKIKVWIDFFIAILQETTFLIFRLFCHLLFHKLLIFTFNIHFCFCWIHHIFHDIFSSGFCVSFICGSGFLCWTIFWNSFFWCFFYWCFFCWCFFCRCFFCWCFFCWCFFHRLIFRLLFKSRSDLFPEFP